MEDEQRQAIQMWVGSLIGQAVAADRFARMEEQKDAVLTKLAADIVHQAAEIYENMNLLVTDQPDGPDPELAQQPDAKEKKKKKSKKKEKTQQLLDYLQRDQTREFDLDDQQDGFSLRNDADLQKHLAANRLITMLSTQLDADLLDAQGVPVEREDGDPKKTPKNKNVKLFEDPRDLENEFYKPLVRQGLLPETFVPSEFSETERMRQGVFDAYAARVEADKKNIFSQLYSENGALLMSVLKAGAAVTASVGQVGQAVKLDASSVNADSLKPNLDKFTNLENASKTFENIETVSTLVGQGLSIVSMGADGVEDIAGAVGGSKRAAAAPALTTNLVATVSAAFNGVLKSTYLGNAYSSSVGAKRLRNSLAADGDFDAGRANEIRDDLAAAIPTALDKCKSATVDTSAWADPMVRKLKEAFDSQGFAKAIQDESFNDGLTLLAQAAQEAAEIAKDQIDQLGEDDRDSLQNAANETLAQEFIDDQRVFEKEERAELERLAAETDFRKKATLLEKRIKEMERDALILKWAESVVGMGIDAAALFIGPMAIAGAAVNLSKNLLRATLRLRDTLKFYHSREDLFRDASPFAPAVSQFVTNASDQAFHYQMQAACELIKLIGAITETAGTASGPGAAAAVAAGKAIQAAGSAAASVEEVLYEIKRRVDLEKAWRSYRLALVRPENRKLALIAMRKNATLAKYAVAWGAVIEKDPLVGDFMNKCGLDAHTLRGESNVDLVVKYLELRMPDDQVITGRSGLRTDWEPSPLELTCACWMLTKQRAEKKAGLLPENSTTIDGALAQFEIEDAKLVRSPFIEKATRDEYLASLTAVRRAFAAYKPQRKSGGSIIRHQQMADVIKGFTEIIDAKEAEIKKLPVVEIDVDEFRDRLRQTIDTPVDFRAFVTDRANRAGFDQLQVNQSKLSKAISLCQPDLDADAFDEAKQAVKSFLATVKGKDESFLLGRGLFQVLEDTRLNVAGATPDPPEDMKLLGAIPKADWTNKDIANAWLDFKRIAVRANGLPKTKTGLHDAIKTAKTNYDAWQQSGDGSGYDAAITSLNDAADKADEVGATATDAAVAGFLSELAELAREIVDRAQFNPDMVDWSGRVTRNWSKNRDEAIDAKLIEKKKTGMSEALRAAVDARVAWDADQADGKKAQAVIDAYTHLIEILRGLRSASTNRAWTRYLSDFVSKTEKERSHVHSEHQNAKGP